jgi:hypothetical protein
MLCTPSMLYITYNASLLIYRLFTQWEQEKNHILYRAVTTTIVVMFLQFLCNRGYYKLSMVFVFLPFIFMVIGYGFALYYFRNQFKELTFFEKIRKINGMVDGSKKIGALAMNIDIANLESVIKDLEGQTKIPF